MIRSCALMSTLLIPSIAFPQNQSPSPYAVLQDDLLDHLVGKLNVGGTTHIRRPHRPLRSTGC
jgi:hypothetical protein